MSKPPLSRREPLFLGFGLAGGLLVIFVVLPLLSTMIATRPVAIIEALKDPAVLSSLGLTLYAAAVATLLALVTGVPLAYLLARHDFIGKRLVESLIDLPVVIPHTAAGIALLVVFGRRGLLGQIVTPLGIEFTGSVAGIVVAMLFVSLPFLVNGAREAFALVDPELEAVALTMGANRWQAFRYVTLPLAGRGILSGALMMWARGMSEFGAVVILAYNPKIVPVVVYERFIGFGLEYARPVAVILILAALIVFILLRALAAPRDDR
ncbi:MAG: ABC transporter permease [Anaerolineae bacterium]